MAEDREHDETVAVSRGRHASDAAPEAGTADAASSVEYPGEYTETEGDERLGDEAEGSYVDTDEHVETSEHKGSYVDSDTNVEGDEPVGEYTDTDR